MMSTVPGRADAVRVPTPEDLSDGRILGGRYRIHRRLGSSVLGVVYESRDLQTGARVALRSAAKEIFGTNPKPVVPAGLREVMEFRHPRVVRVLHVDRLEGLDIIVNELVEGPSLYQQYIRASERPLDAEVGVGILLDVIEALELVHAAGLVHGHLSPHVLTIPPADPTRIRNLEWASCLPRGAQLAASVGGEPWSSPQLLEGKAVCPADDIYGIGATLYHVLHGTAPFGNDLATARRGHLKLPLPESPRIPRELFAIIQRAMSKNPLFRYATPHGLYRALASLGFVPRSGPLDLGTASQTRPPVARPSVKGPSDLVVDEDSYRIRQQQGGRLEDRQEQSRAWSRADQPDAHVLDWSTDDTEETSIHSIARLNEARAAATPIAPTPPIEGATPDVDAAFEAIPPAPADRVALPRSAAPAPLPPAATGHRRAVPEVDRHAALNLPNLPSSTDAADGAARDGAAPDLQAPDGQALATDATLQPQSESAEPEPVAPALPPEAPPATPPIAERTSARPVDPLFATLQQALASALGDAVWGIEADLRDEEVESWVPAIRCAATVTTDALKPRKTAPKQPTE